VLTPDTLKAGEVMENQLLQSDHSTEQPHFDEEWTLLTARPVVPLNEVADARRKRRMLKLAVLFSSALILGALAALGVVRFERSRAIANTQAEFVAEQTEVIPSSPISEPPASEENQVQEPAVPVESAVASAPKTIALVREKTKTPERHVAANSPAPAKSAKQNQPVDVDSNKRPQAQLFDEWQGRWEERRARRIRRQDRRERSGRRGRDLRRIDEIFEGERP
jgi:hypothetical protein